MQKRNTFTNLLKHNSHLFFFALNKLFDLFQMYQRSRRSSEKAKEKNDLNQNQRRLLKNENLQLIFKSSEYLLEDFIELESQAC